MKVVQAVNLRTQANSLRYYPVGSLQGLSSLAGKAGSKSSFSELNKVSKNVTRTHLRVKEKKGSIEEFSQEKPPEKCQKAARQQGLPFLTVGLLSC